MKKILLIGLCLFVTLDAQAIVATICASNTASAAAAERIRNNSNGDASISLLSGQRYRVIAVNTYSSLIWVYDKQNQEIIELKISPRSVSETDGLMHTTPNAEFRQILNDILKKESSR